MSFLGDVCLRSGKWYYEVEVHALAPHARICIGWLSSKSTTQDVSSGVPGQNGQSWAFHLNTKSFVHGGSTVAIHEVTGTPFDKAGAPNKAKAAKALASTHPSAAAMKKGGAASAGDIVGPLGEGSVIGVGIDLDSGDLWWRVCSDEPLQPFGTCSIDDGVFPVINNNNSSSQASFKLSVNFGRRPFTFGLPEGYCAVEDPAYAQYLYKI